MLFRSVLLLAFYALIFLPYLPNDHGSIGNDYALFLPDLLTGYFWHLNNRRFLVGVNISDILLHRDLFFNEIRI